MYVIIPAGQNSLTILRVKFKYHFIPPCSFFLTCYWHTPWSILLWPFPFSKNQLPNNIEFNEFLQIVIPKSYCIFLFFFLIVKRSTRLVVLIQSIQRQMTVFSNTEAWLMCTYHWNFFHFTSAAGEQKVDGKISCMAASYV